MNAHHRLWSLLDMLRFYAEHFLQIGSLLRSAENLFGNRNDETASQGVDILRTLLETSKKEIDIIGLRQSSKKAKAMIEDCNKDINMDKHASSVAELGRLIYSEMEDGYFLHLAPKERELYEPKEPLFGKEVDTKFPGLIDEIKAAGRCLGLGQSTAGAFHSIRCLEAGIRAISKSLGIPDPTRGADWSWPKLLRAVDVEIERRWPASTGRMSGDAEIFDQLYGSLSGMQNPYRNATMHFDHSYQPEDAKLIFDIVCGFMKNIASRMDESGVPSA